MPVSRRGLLAGAVGLAGAAAVGAAVPEVRHQLLDGSPQSPHPVPIGPFGAHVESAFWSNEMRRQVGFGIAYPADVRPGLPVLLELHGRDDDHREAFGSHHLGAFLSEAVRRGVPPFVVVAADGGASSYWHPRADGTNPARMLTRELLPRLQERGLFVERFAVGGWSMGGYGALLLSEVLGPRRVVAAVPDSPALYLRWKDVASGAFDSREDFERHDVLRRTALLKDIPVRVTCGTSDPFIGGVRALLRALPTAERDLGRGGHDVAWWQHAAPGQLAFAGRHLGAATMTA